MLCNVPDQHPASMRGRYKSTEMSHERGWSWASEGIPRVERGGRLRRDVGKFESIVFATLCPSTAISLLAGCVQAVFTSCLSKTADDKPTRSHLLHRNAQTVFSPP